MRNMELPFIREMFDTIAPRYDFLNRLLSLRQDVYWRKKLVSSLKLCDQAQVLDVACGTGDVAIEILKRKKRVAVLGIDFSPAMIKLARAKIREKGGGKNIYLAVADAFDLPFKPGSFDAVTIAFGIRNIGDKQAVLKAFYDSLKPGGAVGVLELATPEKGLLLSLYMLYFNKVLPVVGGVFSKNMKAYQYLPSSVIKFPKPEIFAEIMRQAGFSSVSRKKLSLGIATLYMGYKA